MKIAVISDLHLGHGGRVDGFGHDDAEFLRFLDHLEGNFERIVLLGDVYETFHGMRPRTQIRELARCKAAHAEIAQRFERPQYRYIHGNHDFVTRHTDDAPEVLTIEADGTRVLFTHGHQLDWVARNARWFSEWIIYLGGWAMRLGLKSLIHMVERIETRIRGESTQSPLKDRFQRAAIELASNNDADIVVTGHTHSGGAYEHGNHLFMNSGSCSDGEFSFVSIDTKAGAYAHNAAW